MHLFIERALALSSELFARLLRFIKPEEIILSARPARLTVSRGSDRQQKKAESKFKGNREERRLELPFSQTPRRRCL